MLFRKVLWPLLEEVCHQALTPWCGGFQSWDWCDFQVLSLGHAQGLVGFQAQGLVGFGVQGLGGFCRFSNPKVSSDLLPSTSLVIVDSPWQV